MTRPALIFATIAAVAFALGQSAAQHLAGQLPFASATRLPRASPAVRPPASSAERVLAGGLFRPEPTSPRAPTPDSGPIPCGDTIRLVGIAIVHRPHVRAYAALVSPDGRAVVRVGAAYAGFIVRSIDRDRVRLANAEQTLCELRLFDEGRVHTLPSDLALPAPAPSDDVRQISEGQYTISRRAIRRYVERPSSIRLLPHQRGFRVFGLRRGDPVARAGIRNGDIIVSVDGVHEDLPSLAMVAYARAGHGHPVRIGVERRGEELEMTYQLSETAPFIP